MESSLSESAEDDSQCVQQERARSSFAPPSVQREKHRGKSVMRVVMAHASRVMSGVLDSLGFLSVWQLLRRSRELWVTIRDAVIFNFIWMGVSFVKSALLGRWIQQLVGDGSWVLDVVFMLTWNLPVYLCLWLLSIFWHNAIVQESCRLLGRKAIRQIDPMQALMESSAKVADEVYRLLVVAVFYICAKIIQLLLAQVNLRLLGAFIYNLSNCWMASFYAMEYVWTTLGWNLEERITFFESRWSYLGGFGLPITLATFSLPFLQAAAVYATFFPFLVILATCATPKSHVDSFRLRLFALPMHAAHAVVEHGLKLIGW
uniref:Etoposide-induced protein 2.4 n=1 Tax=Guillardia theta TaxID=55529 RepID=A0A7S4PFE2_GUITH|mmetsp:Transcript_4988/g.18014  ORF Transcript_4988/g.18014 Transcript_4988/m.18014 type:complete len:317 (+) Transcript_4988:140-1090(+)